MVPCVKKALLKLKINKKSLSLNRQAAAAGAQQRRPTQQKVVVRMSAVEILKGIFPSVDAAVIEVVLDSCGNDLERSIDQLLVMTTVDDANIKNQDESKQQFENSSLRKMIVPDEFLLLPHRFRVKLIGDDEEQVASDLMFAEMIANATFRKELNKHKEFTSKEEWGWGDLSEAAKTKFSALVTKFQRGQEYNAVPSQEFTSLFPSGEVGTGGRKKSSNSESDSDAVEMNSFGMSRMKM